MGPFPALPLAPPFPYVCYDFFMDSPVLCLKIWGQRKPSQALSPAKGLLVPMGIYARPDIPAHGAVLCMYQQWMLPQPKRVQNLSIAESSL